MSSNLQANFSKMATIKQYFAIKRDADRESLGKGDKIHTFFREMAKLLSEHIARTAKIKLYGGKLKKSHLKNIWTMLRVLPRIQMNSQEAQSLSLETSIPGCKWVLQNLAGCLHESDGFIPRNARGYSKKFCTGKFRPEVQRYPFRILLLRNGTSFTYLVKNRNFLHLPVF